MSEQVKVMLEYFYPWTNSAGMYYAREQGYYKEYGIDVSFSLYDAGRGDALTYLEEDEVDFGVFPSNRYLVFREKSDKVKSVAAINQRGMETIQTVKSKHISRPAELSGKKIALNPTPRGLAMVRHLVKLDGGDPDSLIIVDTGTREILADEIKNSDIDASFGTYWAWDVLLDRSLPLEERVIWPVDEIGAPPYHSYLLGTRSQLIEEKPELVRNFIAATKKGYEEVVRKPQVAAPIYSKMAPYLPSYAVEESLPLISKTWLFEGKWGVQREDYFRLYAEWLYDNGILKNSDIWKESFTNEYL